MPKQHWKHDDSSTTNKATTTIDIPSWFIRTTQEISGDGCCTMCTSTSNSMNFDYSDTNDDVNDLSLHNYNVQQPSQHNNEIDLLRWFTTTFWKKHSVMKEYQNNNGTTIDTDVEVQYFRNMDTTNTGGAPLSSAFVTIPRNLHDDYQLQRV